MILTKTKKILFLGALALLILVIYQKCFYTNITNRNAPGSNIIAFGDSLTHGTGAAKGEDYPTVLSQLAGREIENRGVPGETSEDALRRIDKEVIAHNPRMVIVLLGGNDLLQRISAETTFKNLEQIITKIHDSGAMVVLVGIEGLMFTSDHGKRFKQLAKRTGCIYVPNILSGILTDMSLKSDQVHPNGKGYRIVAERIYKKIKPYLAT